MVRSEEMREMSNLRMRGLQEGIMGGKLTGTTTAVRKHAAIWGRAGSHRASLCVGLQLVGESSWWRKSSSLSQVLLSDSVYRAQSKVTGA
jgi:hypothetical protein